MKKITILLIMLLVVTIGFSQTTIFSENFDGSSLPANWTNHNTGTGTQTWVFGSGVVPGSVADFSTNAAIFNDDGAGNTGNHDSVWLWHGTTGIDTTTYGQVTLSYDYALNEGGNGETLTVGVWDNTNTGWIPLKVYTVDADPTSDSIDITSAINTYPNINPSAVYIGFGYDDNTSWGWGAGIDNVLLTGSVQPVNDAIFVHTSTVTNINNNRTIINHPDLNGNPDAKIVVSHNWNPGGLGGVYNDNVTGVWYNGTNWTIFNENNNINMIAGRSFNIYIRGNDSNVITHIATLENQNGIDSYSYIDNPILNGDPNANIVMDNYYNPNSIYNNSDYGFFYNTVVNQWVIYSESSSAITIGTAFNVIVSPSNDNVESFRHQSTLTNIAANSTVINHPLLNGKPNAAFVFSHNWGALGDTSNIMQNKTQGVWYNGSSWLIYNEDLSAMDENVLFNIVVMNSEVVSTSSNELTNFIIHPNPVQNNLTIESQEEITKVTIFNLLGQEVKTSNPVANNVNIDVNNLKAGVYIIKVIANDKESTKKFIKK